MFDIHTHSYCSDGSDAPAAVVEKAHEAGLSLFALTDHDTVSGVAEAEARSSALKLPFLTGCELEAEYKDTLHILAVGIDVHNMDFIRLMQKKLRLRDERNERLTERLRKLSMDVSSELESSHGATTRANYAAALVKLGFASSTRDAFDRILGRGCIAYIKQQHPSPTEVVETIEAAGGLAIIAHPMKMKLEPSALVADMARLGVRGVEAFYGAATDGEARAFAFLAKQNGLFVTSGSDYHGARRPEATLARGWRECEELRKTERMLLERTE